MEQLPVEHRGGPGQPQTGRGLRGRDFGLRGPHHQGPQGRPLRLQQLLQTHIQGQFFNQLFHPAFRRNKFASTDILNEAGREGDVNCRS